MIFDESLYMHVLIRGRAFLFYFNSPKSSELFAYSWYNETNITHFVGIILLKYAHARCHVECHRQCYVI